MLTYIIGSHHTFFQLEDSDKFSIALGIFTLMVSLLLLWIPIIEGPLLLGGCFWLETSSLWRIPECPFQLQDSGPGGIQGHSVLLSSLEIFGQPQNYWSRCYPLMKGNWCCYWWEEGNPCALLMGMPIMFSITIVWRTARRGAWRDVSMVENMYCYRRGSAFHSHPPCQVAHNSEWLQPRAI